MQLRLFILFFVVFGFVLQVSAASTTTPFFTIHKGDSVFEIARNLKSEGFIKSRFTFVVPLLFTGKYKKLQAGRYALSLGMSNKEIVRLFEEGRTAAVRIDIIPGMTINDISKLLSKGGLPQSEEFLRLALPDNSVASANSTTSPNSSKFSQKFMADRPKGAGLEGYLYPDSYLIESTETAEGIIDRLLNNFDTHVLQSTSTPPLPKKRSLYEIVTMASILEKEVRTLEDKKKVAGILWKRQEVGMPLQVDSSGKYFLEKNKAGLVVAPDNMTYNTYDHVGLPWGPISNPSLESLTAAMKPTASDYWYYLSSRDGTTIYSRTLGEHLINKAKFVD
ncbi:MAG: endolytic transglycosylase MltG [Patescibacteria group bacterium]